MTLPNTLQMDVMSTPYVVVYGTLKKGFSNHRLLTEAEQVGIGRVYGQRTLNNTWPPTFSPNLDETIPFEGEVYKVTEDTLHNLDRLEGHPYGYYRTQVDVYVNLGDGVTDVLRAWCYFYYTEGTESCQVEDHAYVWKEGA